MSQSTVIPADTSIMNMLKQPDSGLLFEKAV